MRFGVCTSYEQAHMLSSIGFDYVEVHAGNLASMSSEEFAAFCEFNATAPIHAEAANCLFPGELQLTGPAVDWAAVEAYIDKALGRLGAAGIRTVCFGSGGCRKYPDDFPAEEARQQMIRVCRTLALTGEKYGVTVTLEPLRPAETNMINSMAEGRRLVEEVNHPNFRLLCDLYHVLENGDLPEDAAIAGHHLSHIHMCSASRCASYPGDGTDYAAFFQALKDIGYNGRVSFEGRCTDPESELPGVLAVMKTFSEG